MKTSAEEELVANSVVSLVVSWLSCRLSTLTFTPLAFSYSGMYCFSRSP
jgi:hypothetical protein